MATPTNNTQSVMADLSKLMNHNGPFVVIVRDIPVIGEWFVPAAGVSSGTEKRGTVSGNPLQAPSARRGTSLPADSESD